MHKPLRLLLALLPVCGLGLLAGEGPLLPRLLPTPDAAAKSLQQKPASSNATRRVILTDQYRFYLRSHHRPNCALRAAAMYNQCISDSDPSVLRGTVLPTRLP